MPCDWYVKYAVIDPPTPEALANVLDISAGGLRIRARQTTPVGTQLQLRINSVPIGRVISSMGKVLRVQQTAPGVWEWGVVFEEMAEQDRTELNEKIEKLQSPGNLARHRRAWWRAV